MRLPGRPSLVDRLHDACSGPEYSRGPPPSTCPRSHNSPGRIRSPHRAQLTLTPARIRAAHSDRNRLCAGPYRTSWSRPRGFRDLCSRQYLCVELRGMNSLEQPRFAHLLRAVRSATTTGHGPSACAPARRRTIAPHVTDPDIEEEILRAFIRRERADRYVAQLRKKMRRERLRFDLDNLFDLDGRWIRGLSREEDNPRALYALLRKLGAPEGCYVMSGDSAYDGAYLDLSDVLNAIHATGMGTIISCVPDKLAYYEGESERFILERP
jgi:hypothetical protein